ncbi:hypothetical protein [Nitrosomonas sp.]|uniref:hypothetical protein n=1 Tax=Nitrosomonas sp. TaxID=42353 RepID=UPI0026350EF2|nr:hypothetical protein [Nitrosomonas sp.]
MCAKIRICMTACLSFLLIGCVNPPMYFYETEKISLTVEARPDSSQPVQGSLGIKQRLALVAPKKNQNDSSKGVGEAVSALSSFSFKIMPEKNNLFDPVLIQTAFITGEAAAKLNNPEDVAKAARAITLGGNQIENMDTHAECVITNAINTVPNKIDLLKEIVKKDNSKNFSDKDWNNLIDIAKPCGISDRMLYADSTHQALQKKLNK